MFSYHTLKKQKDKKPPVILHCKLVSLSFFKGQYFYSFFSVSPGGKLGGTNSSDSTNKRRQSPLLDGNYSISVKIILAPLNLDKHSQS